MCFSQFAGSGSLKRFVADFWNLDKPDQDSLDPLMAKSSPFAVSVGLNSCDFKKYS